MRTITAKAEHGDGWWVISVPEIEGLFTQTRRLDEIPAMVRDPRVEVIALVTGQLSTGRAS